MKPMQILDKLKSLGITVHRNTLLNYEKLGLIPPAEFRDGHSTNFPFETYAELFASYLVKRDYGKYKPTNEALKEIRELALKTAESNEELELIQGIVTVERELAFKWLLFKHKALEGMTIDEIYENERAGDALTEKIASRFNG